jgi:transposase-like protein
MSRSIFSAPHFNDEAAAYAYVEARIWADGRVCPHCGVLERSAPLKGKRDRVGLYKCYACRKPFTVKIGAIFEDSHIAMRDWLTAMHLICSSKKGISANQLHRTLGITLKSAWFLGHRIREAMRSGELAPMGGPGTIVEIDETFIGNKADMPKRRGFAHKQLFFRLSNAAAQSVASMLPARPPLIGSNPSRQHRKGNVRHDRRSWSICASRQRVCQPRIRQSQYWRIWPWRGSYKHRRRLLQRFQARHERHLSALQRTAFAPVCCRIRLPL